MASKTRPEAAKKSSDTAESALLQNPRLISLKFGGSLVEPALDQLENSFVKRIARIVCIGGAWTWNHFQLKPAPVMRPQIRQD
jgi:hypothetical protein